MYVKHFGIVNVKFKFIASQAKSTYLYKNLRSKLLRYCASIHFNKQCLAKKKKNCSQLRQRKISEHFTKFKIVFDCCNNFLYLYASVNFENEVIRTYLALRLSNQAV